MEMGSLPLIRTAWIIPGSPSSDRHWGMVTGRNIPPLFRSSADWRRAKEGGGCCRDVCVCLCRCKHPCIIINEAVWLEWASKWAQTITWIPPVIAYLYAHTCFFTCTAIRGGVKTVKAHSSYRSKYKNHNFLILCDMCTHKHNKIQSGAHIHTHTVTQEFIQTASRAHIMIHTNTQAYPQNTLSLACVQTKIGQS